MKLTQQIQKQKHITKVRPKTFLPNVPLIQKKLSIGAASDVYEVEADAMADKVVQMRDPQVNFQPQSSALVQRKCAACEEDILQKKTLASEITPMVQRKSHGAQAGTASKALTQQINSSKGHGHRMDKNTQSFMESRFGADFSGVRIHTGFQAVQMSRGLNAQAFTVGNDVYFNEGKYNPTSTLGKHLLAHELTHTIQQGKSNNSNPVVPQSQAINSSENRIQRAMLPPGDCTPEEYLILNGAVQAAKSISQNGKCDNLYHCSDIIRTTLGITTEVTARIARDTKCFKGGDQKHRERIRILMGRLDTCMLRLFLYCSEKLRKEAEDAIRKVREMFEMFMKGVLVLAVIVVAIAALVVLAKILAAATVGAVYAGVAAAIILILVGIKDLIASDDDDSTA